MPDSPQPDSPQPERTPDGRYLVIGGRRWRASDPAIPDKLRQELVDELMAARRAVRDRRDGARARVQDAKVALGERGAPWWEPADDDAMDERIAATIRTLLRKRDGSSICPSDVARVVGGDDWRDRMEQVRGVAAALKDAEVLVISQRGEPVAADAAGPIRLSQGPRWC